MSNILPFFLKGIKVVSDTKTSASGKFSRLCDIADWDSQEFNLLACDILDLGVSREAPQHRKLWEFTVCVQALTKYGLLKPNTVGLSVAAGYERILYYLARKIDLMVATDIYGEGSFAYREATREAMSHPDKFAPYPYPQNNLMFYYMNAFDLEFQPCTFDFCICLSSIEHFGGIEKAITALKQMNRVIREGGLVVVTTECSLNGKNTNEVFSISEIKQLITQSGLCLVDDLDLSLTARSLEYLLDMRRDNVEVIPHINLRAYGSDFTSICLVLKKQGTLLDDKEFMGNRRVYLNQYSHRESSYSQHSLPKFSNYKAMKERINKIGVSIKLRLQEWFSLETWYLLWLKSRFFRVIKK